MMTELSRYRNGAEEERTMKITKERTGGVMTVALEGRLDSTGVLEL